MALYSPIRPVTAAGEGQTVRCGASSNSPVRTSPGKRVTTADYTRLESRVPDRLRTERCSMERESVIVSDPEILGGTPCFRGTRVPVDSLIDYLEAGDTLDEFLDNFPSVTREAAIAALEEAKALLTSPR